YYRGWIDTVIARATDVLLSFPFVILAVGLAAILGPSLDNATLALGIGAVPAFIRIARGETLALREEDYVPAAIANGATDRTIIFKHILPNMTSTLLVQATLTIPGAIVGEAVLSFLGLGVQPPQTSWGVMLQTAQDYLSQAPRLAVFPGVALVLAVMADPLLEVSDLSVRFDTDDGPVHAVDKMSFSLAPGEVLGIVGESGCGKSVTCMSLTRLLPETATVTGRAVFDGRDLLTLAPRSLRRVRGREIAYVFQEPMTSLNPVFTVGHQIDEILRRHLDLSRRDARAQALELLKLVRIPAPERRLDEYPHQLSGGMRQRVMIAIALACDPKVLIADEPTTALDVTIQA